MISVTNLRTGTAFEDEGQIYQVLSYEHLKLGRGSANVKVKVKNLKTGAITEKSFISGAKVQEVSLKKLKVQYLYQDNLGGHFMDTKTFEQFAIGRQKLGDRLKFLKEGMEVDLLFYEEEPLFCFLPLKIEFKVGETGPDIRGNSATNIFKEAILENGLKVKVPLFIKAGDRVLVDTQTGEYVERVK